MPRRIRSSWILGAFRFVSATDFPDQHLSVPPVDAVLLPAGIPTVADPNNENDQDVLPMGRVKSMGLRLGGKWDGLRLTGLPWDTLDTGRDRSTIGCVPPGLVYRPLPVPAFPASPISPVIRSPRRRSMDRAENHFGPMSPIRPRPSHWSRRPWDLDSWTLGFPKETARDGKRTRTPRPRGGTTGF